jgi:hypothetical protein
LSYGRIFWPELVKVGEFVLLSEQYDPEYFARVSSECEDRQIESTINTVYLPDLFGPVEVDEKTWSELGRLVAQCWKARAETAFPEMSFVATFQWYSADGDPGVSLCQERYSVGEGASGRENCPD